MLNSKIMNWFNLYFFCFMLVFTNGQAEIIFEEENIFLTTTPEGLTTQAQLDLQNAFVNMAIYINNLAFSSLLTQKNISVPLTAANLASLDAAVAAFQEPFRGTVIMPYVTLAKTRISQLVTLSQSEVSNLSVATASGIANAWYTDALTQLAVTVPDNRILRVSLQSLAFFESQIAVYYFRILVTGTCPTPDGTILNQFYNGARQSAREAAMAMPQLVNLVDIIQSNFMCLPVQKKHCKCTKKCKKRRK